MIHSIKTSNFGTVFDWSQNILSKNSSWKTYLHNELDMYGRIKIFENNLMLTKSNFSKLLSLIKRIEKWKKLPVLNH